MQKNTIYSSSSTKRHLLSLDFTENNNGIAIFSNRIDGAHADMCFSNITITYSIN